MHSSFYIAGSGMAAQQNRLDTIANNIANTNTTAFKSKRSVFGDLMYTNYQALDGEKLQEGKGVALMRNKSSFNTAGVFQTTGQSLDFAIQGNGYFAVSDLEGENIQYTRDGRFMISNIDDAMYLTNSSGQLVLNADEEFIEMDELTINATEEELNIGVFKIPIEDGLIEMGFNNYGITERNGLPEALEEARLLRGGLEASNVDIATEFSQMIEAQRAYQMAARMVTTSDEVEQQINNLRR